MVGLQLCIFPVYVRFKMEINTIKHGADFGNNKEFIDLHSDIDKT